MYHVKKVLFVATVYNTLAAFIIPFMKLLQEKGHEVHAAASSNEGQEHKSDVEAAGVKCWDIPFARSPYNLANLQAYHCLRALLKEHHFDLIHVHTPIAAFLGRYLAKITHQGPVLYTVHGFHFYRGAPKRNWLIYYTAERIAANWTDGLIVINSEDFENAKRLGFKPGENLFYVPGVGVNLDQFCTQDIRGSGIRVALGINSNDVVVTCVAEFNKNKNHNFLLSAWREFTKQHDSSHLLLVGAGENISALQKLVKRKKIPRVYFLGYRTDVSEILIETDIVTLVSKREGLPKSIMEAMAAGKPVIASNVRGNRNLIEDGHNGFLVNLGDTWGLVAALKRLTLDSKLRVAMGAANREKIKDYALDRVLSKMAEIYDRYLIYGG